MSSEKPLAKGIPRSSVLLEFKTVKMKIKQFIITAMIMAMGEKENEVIDNSAQHFLLHFFLHFWLMKATAKLCASSQRRSANDTS